MMAGPRARFGLVSREAPLTPPWPGPRLIDRLGGGDRKDADGDQASGSALAIVRGSVLDGMPGAFEHGGKGVGVTATLGFAVAVAIHVLD